MALRSLTPGLLALLNSPRFGTSGGSGLPGTAAARSGGAGGRGQGFTPAPAHLKSTPAYSSPGAPALTLAPYAQSGTGGNGGAGTTGRAGTSEANAIGGYNYGNAGTGGRGGNGGGSNRVTITLSDVQLGDTDALTSDIAPLGASAAGGNGGIGGNGGTGGYAGFDSAIAVPDGSGGSTITPTGHGGTAGNGGQGGRGGNGANSIAQVDHVQGTLAGGSSWSFQATASGGTGGTGGRAGAGGSGSPGGSGGTGGDGGNGGLASAGLSDFGLTVTSAGSMGMSVSAFGGSAGHGGDGGSAGASVQAISGQGTTTTYTNGGRGGAGGTGGDATATYAGNVVTASASLDLTISLIARAGSQNGGGAGGSGGSSSYFGGNTSIAGTPGSPGLPGTTGTPMVVLSNNSIDLAGGGTLHLSLTAANGTGLSGPLSAASGTLTFSSNHFDGSDWKLDLTAVARGAATIDINAHTLQLADSPTNFLSGVSAIDGTIYSDRIADGAGNQSYGVYNSFDAAPDTITFAAGHGHDAIKGAGFSGVLVNLQGFAGLASYTDVQAASSTGFDSLGSYTEVATPDGGSIRFESTFGLQPTWFTFT